MAADTGAYAAAGHLDLGRGHSTNSNSGGGGRGSGSSGAEAFANSHGQHPHGKDSTAPHVTSPLATTNPPRQSSLAAPLAATAHSGQRGSFRRQRTAAPGGDGGGGPGDGGTAGGPSAADEAAAREAAEDDAEADVDEEAILFEELVAEASLEANLLALPYWARVRESLFAKAHKRWTIRLLVLGVLFVLGWILSERKPDSTLYNASWTAWCILVAVLVVLYPISRLMGWLTIGVALMASRLLPGGVKERRKLFLYEMAPYCGYFIWSVLALIAFEVVMGINPYPARNNLGETLSVNDKADWIRRLLGVNIGIGILLLLKSYALTTINLQRRIESYEEKIAESTEDFEVLSRLSVDIDNSVFAQDWSIAHPLSEEAAASKIQAFMRRLLQQRATPTTSTGDGSGKSLSASRSRSKSKRGSGAARRESQASPETASAPAVFSSDGSPPKDGEAVVGAGASSPPAKPEPAPSPMSKPTAARPTGVQQSLGAGGPSQPATPMSPPTTAATTTPTALLASAAKAAAPAQPTAAAPPSTATAAPTPAAAPSQQAAAAVAAAAEATALRESTRPKPHPAPDATAIDILSSAIEEEDEEGTDVDNIVRGESAAPAAPAASAAPASTSTEADKNPPARQGSTMSTMTLPTVPEGMQPSDSPGSTRSTSRLARLRSRNAGTERVRTVSEHSRMDPAGDATGSGSNCVSVASSSENQGPTGLRLGLRRRRGNTVSQPAEESLSVTANGQLFVREMTGRAGEKIVPLAAANAPQVPTKNNHNTEPRELKARDAVITLLKADRIRQRYLEVCNGTKAIKTSADAERLGEAIFAHFRSKNKPDYVFLSKLRHNRTERMSRIIKRFFHLGERRRLTKDDIVACCKDAYHRRKNLSLSLADLASLMKSLNHFLNGAVGVCTYILATLVLSSGQYETLVVSLSTTVFALSFIIADSARQVFASFQFLFVRHPYDVGDRVLIHDRPNPDALYVKQLTLSATTFRHWSGEIQTWPNAQLANLRISNVQRSGPTAEVYEIFVAHDTPWEKIDGFIAEFLRACGETENVNAAECMGQVRDINGSAAFPGAIRIALYVPLTVNQQNVAHLPVRHEVWRILHTYLKREGIKYASPVRLEGLSGETTFARSQTASV